MCVAHCCRRHARDPHALERVAATIRDGGGRAIAITADVTDPDALERLRTTAEQQLGPVTLVAAVTGGGVAVSLAGNGDRTVAVRPAAVRAADHIPTTTSDRGYAAWRSGEASRHATTRGGPPGTMRSQGSSTAQREDDGDAQRNELFVSKRTITASVRCAFRECRSPCPGRVSATRVGA